jgi:hypothetical protein
MEDNKFRGSPTWQSAVKTAKSSVGTSRNRFYNALITDFIHAINFNSVLGKIGWIAAYPAIFKN